MARTDTLTHYLTDIADAIREKTGSSDPIQASSFDTAIENIPSGGGEPNWSEIGYSNAPDYVMTAFNYAKDIYDNWDSSVTSLENKYKNDTNLIFMPLVDTSNVTSTYGMFQGSINLVSVPQLNTSNVTTMRYMFYECKSLFSVPQIDTSNVQSIQAIFSYCNKLETIPQLDFGKVSLVSTGAFQTCSNLENLGGFKDLGKSYDTSASENYSAYTLNLSTSPLLTHESLMNVINNLYDIKTKGCNNQKLQLGSTNLAKLTAEEIAIATNKGWNVTSS